MTGSDVAKLKHVECPENYSCNTWLMFKRNIWLWTAKFQCEFFLKPELKKKIQENKYLRLSDKPLSAIKKILALSHFSLKWFII